MSKFNTTRTRPSASSPITTTGERTTTHEGGVGYVREDKSALLLLAVTNMVGEDTFYEKAGDRDDRYTDLVRELAVEDPEWTIDLLRWLRGEANMRSASLVGAAEFVKARLDAGRGSGGITDTSALDTEQNGGYNRQAIRAVLQRADEPGELLAYWTSRYGRNIPKPVKRGVADAVRRLYTERLLLKYDTDSKGYRFGDVLELVHASPDPGKPWQGDLFKHAIDRRHGRDEVIPDNLPVLQASKTLSALPVEDRRAYVLDPTLVTSPGGLAGAGFTWERLAGWLQGPMDRKAWEAIIPSMGYMALLRNLRNFDEAEVSDKVAEQVAKKLADPDEVAKSRQFPYRFLSAYRSVPSLRWGHALEKALAASTANIPALPGKTLVLVDTSASMTDTVSAKSVVRHVDVGALFAVALAARGCEVDLVGFADGVFKHPLKKGGSVLKQTEAFCQRIGEVGHVTQTVDALKSSFDGHARVVIVSDMQAFAYAGWMRASRRVSVSDAIPAEIPMFGIDTSGYAQTSIDTSKPNRYEIGGFSDKLFTMVDLLSRGRNSGWPWENQD